MALYVLDTDTLTLHQHRHHRVLQQVMFRAADTVTLTVWTVEEQVNGWFAYSRAARTTAQHITASHLLQRLVDSWAAFPILPQTAGSIAAADRLDRLRINVGRYDLRIAAVALDAGAVVVTRNRRDFGRVPGLVIEDWSV